jgi:hypothetical protein
MKITVNNIVDQYPQIKVDLPLSLNQDEFEFIRDNIDLYSADETIKKYIDTFVEKLNAFLARSGKKGEKPTFKPAKAKPVANKKTVKPKKKEVKKDVPEIVPIEHFIVEEKFLKRYLLLDGKTKTKSQVLNFIKALQKAIVEKQIRKTSRYAAKVEHIQKELIKLYEKNTRNEFKVELEGKIAEELRKLFEKKKVRLSVTYIKRFIGFYGNKEKEKAERLLALIEKAIKNEKILKNDPYYDRVLEIKKALENYLDKGTVSISESEIRGLAGMAGIYAPKPKPSKVFKDTEFVSSMELKNVHFSYMGFSGIWKKIIGDPENPFHVMIYGAGGKGKSTFAVKFAKYLSNDLGLKSLIVADEEKVSGKLKDKLSLFNAYNPSLFLTGKLPGSMKGLDIVFIDSVTSMGMEPEELEVLQKKYPAVSFIYILQTNKQGKFYGKKKWEHLCDVMLRFEDGTVGVEKNRFGKVGEYGV